MLGCIVMYAIYFVICSFLFYAIFPKTTGQRKRRAAANGAIVAFMATAVMRFAVASHPLASFGLELVAGANVVYSFIVWRDIAASEGGSLRVSSAICATILILCVCWLPLAYSLDCFVRGLGSNHSAMVLGSWALAIAFTVLLAAVWSTFCRQRRYSRGVVAVRWIAIVLAVIMTVSSVVSAAVAVPQSKSVKAAGIPSVFATDSEAFEGLKEFFGRIFGNSKEAALAETDDESVAAEVADESDEADAEAKKKAEAEAEAKKKAEAGPDEGVVVKWDDYDGVVQKHPEFNIQNYPLTLDDIPENNAFFGPSIYNDGDTEQDVYKRVRKMVQHCPLIFAEMAAIVDQACKTDLCGSYYNGNDAEWASAINQMVEECFDTPGVFVNLDGKFLAHLDNEVVGLELRQMKQIKDQFYLDIYTRRGIPRLVVCETYQSGMVLIIWLRTKGPDPINDVGIGVDTNCCNVCGVFKRDGSFTPVSEEMDIQVEKVPEMPKGYDPPAPKKAPTPTPKPTSTPKPTPTTPGEGSDPPAKKAPKEDVVNRNGGASTGGGDNTSDGGVDEEQHEDPREEVVAPAEVEPETPPVVEAYHEEPVVSYEEPVNYASDPVTDRGAADGATAPTSEGGDGEFVPED